MTTIVHSTDIGAAIAALHRETEIPSPTTVRRIVPLSDLVASYNLTCSEVRELTSHKAISYLLQRGGLVEPPGVVDQEHLAGFIYATTAFGAIFVEQGDFLVRRRFSIAHELGHYLLHFRPLLTTQWAGGEPAVLEAMEVFPISDEEAEPGNLPIGHITFTRPENEEATASAQMEREANQFAGELLMPETVARELAAQYAPHIHGEDLVWRLSTEMLVSRSAMRWRLRALGLLPPASAQWN